MTRRAAGLGAFVPGDVRAALAAGAPLPEQRCGSVLEADISAFTPLTERLAKLHGPRRGAEEVAALLDRLYGPLVAEVDRAGGTVVEFLGDAIVCCFDRDDGARALRCGLAMQEAVGALRGDGADAPAVKVAVANGAFRRLCVGDRSVRLHDVLAGEAVDALVAVSAAAEPGEVLVDARTAQKLRTRVRVRARRAAGTRDCAVVASVAGVAEAPPAAPAPIADDDARPWLPATVHERLRAGGEELLGELRSAVALFARFGGIDYGEPDARDRLDAFVRFAQETIGGFGGTLLNIAIDAKGSYLYAGFGAPLAHDDDPLRAAAAALALRAPPTAAGAVAPAGIGIAGGRMYAGTYGGSTRRTYGLQGSKVNLAARLMQAASGSMILVESPLAARLGERYDLRARDPLTVKGRTGTVAVHELAGVREAFGGPSAARRGHGALVDRAGEREALEALVTAVAAGDGGVTLLEGEPGIGKSRLLDHLAERATQAGARVLAGGGDPIERGAPLHGWRPVFSRALGVDAPPAAPDTQPGLALARLRDIGGELAPLLSAVVPVALPDTAQTARLAGEARGEATRDLLSRALVSLAAERPTLVVLEDAHWLDSASLALALRLASAPGPLALVLSTRPLAHVEQLELRRIAELDGCLHLPLGPLPPADARELAGHAAGVQLPDEAAALIEAKAGGNPLFTRELAYALRERGMLDGDGSVGAIALESPDTVEAVIAGRLDRLPGAAQATLKIASVLGLSFTPGALDVLAHTATASAVELLVRHDLLGAAAGELTFRHALIRDVVYERLLHAQRRELHRRAAEHLEAAGAEQATHAALAHHWERAEVPDRAAAHLAAAGEQALRAGAAQEAADAYGRALELTADEGLSGRRAAWTWYLAQARYRLGELEGATACGAAAIAALDRPVPERTPGVIAAVLRELARQIRHRRLAARATERLARSAPDADPELRRVAVEAQLMMAEVYYLGSDKARSSYVALRSLNLAEGLGPSIELAQCYGAICIIAGILGRHALAERYGELARETAARVGDPFTDGLTIHQLCMYRSSRGPYESFADLYREGIAVLRAINHKPRLRDALMIAAIADHLFGRPDEAERKLGELLATIEPQEITIAETWANTWLGAVELRRGRAADALERLHRAERLARARELDSATISVLALSAVALRRAGRPAAARVQERAAWELVRHFGRRPTSHAVLDGYAALAELALARWDEARSPAARRRARRRARQARANLRAYTRVFGIGTPARALYEGELAWRRGRRTRALRAWENAMAESRRLDMRHELALAHAALGDRLVPPRAARHRERAEELLRELRAPPQLRAVTAAAAAAAPRAGVAAELADVAADLRARRSPAAFFAAVQAHVGSALEAAAAAGELRDPEALLQVHDAAVARHVAALRAWARGAPVPEAWAIALDADEACLAQHLLLGMNAHVRLDLPVVLAARLREGPPAALRADLERASSIAASIAEAAAAEVAAGWPALERLGRGRKAPLVDVGLRAARVRVWETAGALAAGKLALARIDAVAAARARAIARPPRAARLLARAASAAERAGRARIAEDLAR